MVSEHVHFAARLRVVSERAMRSVCLVTVLFGSACASGSARGQVGDVPDARTSSPDAELDAAADAAAAQCTYVPASASVPVLSFTFSGGSFASFGCAPVDPTYWLSGAGMSVTVTFAQPQTSPSLRVWGMNTDDTARVVVNGATYTLDATSATPAPKITCGLSPGPDGVAFVGGLLTGANTPAAGNYSYQDVTLNGDLVSLALDSAAALEADPCACGSRRRATRCRGRGFGPARTRGGSCVRPAGRVLDAVREPDAQLHHIVGRSLPGRRRRDAGRRSHHGDRPSQSADPRRGVHRGHRHPIGVTDGV
jgi:hypothetical protein